METRTSLPLFNRRTDERAEARATRDANRGFSENPPPVKGSIMRKLSNKQLKAIEIASISVLGIIAIKQTRKVSKLQSALVRTQAQRDFYTDVTFRATSMMNLPQMLHLVDDTLTDVNFRQIIRNNGL